MLLPRAKQASKVLTVLQLAARPSRLESMLSDLSVVDSSKPLPVGTSTAQWANNSEPLVAAWVKRGFGVEGLGRQNPMME